MQETEKDQESETLPDLSNPSNELLYVKIWQETPRQKTEEEQENEAFLPVVASIQRIHDSAKLHPQYETLRSPVDEEAFVKDRFDANNVHGHDVAALVPLAEDVGHFDNVDDIVLEEALIWQMMVIAPTTRMLALRTFCSREIDAILVCYIMKARQEQVCLSAMLPLPL